jgi:hypothetical protein
MIKEELGAERALRENAIGASANDTVKTLKSDRMNRIYRME